MSSDNLRRAREDKEDEFYTRLADIENELKHYKNHLKGKTIFCNCDDPYESNFFKYFAMNFNELGIKKLIATCYDGSPVSGTQLSLFDDDITPEKTAYKIVINEVDDYNKDGVVNLADVEYLLKNKKNVLTKLNKNGDFRSEECIELLKESDLVITNPPFSLFREYVALLIKYKKKFLIIGNQNAVAYKEIFPLIKNNEIWLGFTSPKEFFIPKKIERKNVEERNGQYFAKFGNICWYSNLDISKRHESLIETLYKTYNKKDYPKYDNYDGIDVNKIADIPVDYKENMGVPITFLEKYNPEEFSIIGMGTGDNAKEIGITKNYRGRTDLAFKKNGKSCCPYNRIIIRRK